MGGIVGYLGDSEARRLVGCLSRRDECVVLSPRDSQVRDRRVV
jgi:hypothetical protein